MNKIWEFYENLNEIEYVCDMDTYEIEYMNRKARELWGITSQEEVRGKKCYELLQNRTAPCEFCTNHLLKEGEFYEWQSHNDVLGKDYALKDTMLVNKGKRYRVELAIDMSVQEAQKNTILNYIKNEMMVNKGLRIALSKATPVESLNTLMEYLGTQLKSERTYIFESEGKIVRNTYEWCADDVEPQKDNLQEVPLEVVSLWYERFIRNENVIISSVEAIKESDPLAYEYLKPQDISVLVVSPIFDDEKIIGFFGVDNPPSELLNHISTLFSILGHFIMSLIKRRNLVQRLESMSYYDQLTGLKNRHAMYDYLDAFGEEESIGILYIDLMGLKKVNDTLGHKEGDNMLKRARRCLQRCCVGHEIFRVGGDEFVVICKGITERHLHDLKELLRMDTERNNARMAIGCEWNAKYDNNIDHLLISADHKMYEDKKKYYESMAASNQRE
uniref:sensor domain-containing diguanylate cyclase n=1 Tax=Acetatifactor sp. TaxID=1872090 RepID=UPI0040567D28